MLKKVIGTVGLAALVAGLGYWFFLRQPLRPAAVASEPVMSYDIFLVLDHSGSMIRGKEASDPEGLRVHAARYFIDYLKSFAREGARDRVGVVNFATDAPGTLQHPLADLQDPTAVEVLKKKIRDYAAEAVARGDRESREFLRWTSFIRAFEAVRDLYLRAKDPKPLSTPVLILFTDGEPEDARRLTKEAYFAELRRFTEEHLRGLQPGGRKDLFPVSFQIFVIGLDRQGRYWHRDERFWRQIATGGTFRLREGSEEEMEAVYGRVLETLLATVPGEWKDLAAEQVEKITVPPYTDKVTISVLKERRQPTQTVEVKDPAGRVVRPEKEPGRISVSSGERVDLYVLKAPAVGEWQLRLTEPGKVRIKTDLLPIEFRLISPKTPHPLGEPLVFSAKLLRSDGAPVVPLPEHPLRLSATLAQSGGPPTPLRFEQDPAQPGRYTVKEPIPTPGPGEYRLAVDVTVGTFAGIENFSLLKREIAIPVEPLISFRVSRPALDRANHIFHPILYWRAAPLLIEGQLYREGKARGVEELFGGDANRLVLVGVRDENGAFIGEGQTVDFLTYRPETKSFFREIRGIQKPGQYTLVTKIEGPLETGRRYTRQEEFSFAIVYGWPQLGMRALVFLLLARLFAEVPLRIRRGPLTGALFVGTERVGTLRNLWLYNKVRVRSAKRWVFPPWWINELRAQSEKCPTFYVIGSIGEKDRLTKRRDPAVTVFYRWFGLIPWWSRLTRRSPTVNVKGITIRWQP